MKRRDVGAAIAILASPRLGSAAEVAARVARVGVLAFSDATTQPPEGSVFLAELAKQGYVVGRNLAIERRFSQQVGLDAAASGLVALKVDVIYAVEGTPSALAAKRATSAIPIVFQSADPVGFGLVSSLARPGGNLTGVSMQGPAMTSKQMESMAAALGGLKRMAYIHQVGASSMPWFAGFLAAARSAATALGVRIEFHEVPGFAAYEPLIQTLVRRGVEAAELMPAVNPIANVEYDQIASLFLNYHLPAIGPARFGFLLECDFAEDLVKQRIAYFVARILNGTKPTELPVEEFSSLRLRINLKTARALRITIPRSLLLRADEFVQ
jgi:putative tryptophan/tyrosine transport system substrate-binding protein